MVPQARGMGVEAPLVPLGVFHHRFDLQLHAQFCDSDVHRAFGRVGTGGRLHCQCGNSRANLWDNAMFDIISFAIVKE
ncbi:hypothetical protein RJ640_020110 [Escallonia rubra]|uniref:Uncharacterized protein n=1 Tax=Escallonia rubra TaxID=112253 RepID=A0AA88UE96_9ASTE|nr:hypothetical protein RJ640_020110 [Escallonia rubra]